jgi:hypothetical protein
MSPAPDERDRIRAAMDRILQGTPQHSNGALTIVALAQEAAYRATRSPSVTRTSRTTSTRRSGRAGRRRTPRSACANRSSNSRSSEPRTHRSCPNCGPMSITWSALLTN